MLRSKRRKSGTLRSGQERRASSNLRIEAGELEALREAMRAIDAADLAGCSAPLLKQARGRRDALRKTPQVARRRAMRPVRMR